MIRTKSTISTANRGSHEPKGIVGHLRKISGRATTIVACTGAIVLGLCVATPGVIPAASVSAAASGPTEGTGPNGSFYDVPLNVSGDAHGSLLYYQSTSSSELSNVIGYDIAYVSEEENGTPVVVTGSLWIPTAPWTGSGTRPLISEAVGSQGIGTACAPSKLLAGGIEYDSVNISPLLSQGDAVVITDYQWAGTTDTPISEYMIGLEAAHDVLDAVNAAFQVPGTGLSSSTEVVITGYSEGGQASIGAAELWKSYDPSINLVGDSAGGVPGDLLTVAANLNGSFWAGLLADVIVSYHAQYPNLPFNSLLNSAGESLISKISSGTDCLAGEIVDASGKNIDTLTNGGLTLAQLEQDGAWIPTIEANSVGQAPGSGSDFPTYIPVPVYNYRGTSDEIVTTPVEDQVYQNLCAAGTVVETATFPGEHVLTEFESPSDVAAFVKTVTSGGTVTNDCLTNPNSI